jgi:hypothetical protein
VGRRWHTRGHAPCNNERKLDADADADADADVNPAQESANGPEEETAPVSPKRDKAEQKENAIRSKHLVKAPKDLFDNLEQVVLESIRLKHWDAFKQSPDWNKLIEYLWHRDKKVIDEDFFLMRVLGRGGFGLVTGMSICAFLVCIVTNRN